ncbi:MAG: hypothetical protein Q9198_007697 [Flavoplaca austrocitrina]
MAPPASHLNATSGIAPKDKAYERDMEDQSTAEKLTKLCDQMTTAKNLALRSLRGHPDALERVMDSLRGKIR